MNDFIKKRLNGIDELRGIIMVIMALDHVRDFIYHIRFSSTDLSQTSAPLFLTRWITNICAPVFIALAGTGAYLHYRHRKSKPELTRYLVSRGLVILLIELIVMRFSYCFNFNLYIPNTNLVQVLWAIGWSMIGLGFLIYLPGWLMLALSIFMIAGHNLFDGISPEKFGSFSWLWIFLHSPGEITVLPGIIYKVMYPLIPWVGVMALGFLLGRLTDWEEEKRKKFFLPFGLSLLGLFIIIRWINVYGDPSRWTVQKNWLFTFFSFINCTKYPPSLLYLLTTIGMGFVIIALIRNRTNPALNFFLVFGNVPMFYYILHFFFAHLFIILYAAIQYKTMPLWLFHDNPIYGCIPQYPTAPADFGYGLLVVYLTWIAVVLMLYPLCKRYMQYKRTHNNIITQYL